MSDVNELVEVDPGVLVVGANVRTNLPDAKDFAKSIKERGVLEVITAYRAEDGDLVVLRGQRRTVVAAEVGTPSGTVPVRIVESPQDVDRIVDQLTENLHREAMSAGEVLAGVEQLSLLNVSAAQIAKRTALKRPVVDHALTVAQTESVRVHVDDGTWTLEQAAVFAEFDGDEQATAALTRAVEYGRPLAHEAQRLRDQRAERQAATDEVERLRAEGLPVLDVDDFPADIYDVAAEYLRDGEGNAIPEERWPTLTGAVLAVRTEWTDAKVSDGEEEDTYERVRVPVARWVVPDPAAAGLRPRFAQTATGEAAGEPTAEQKEAASAERRLVRENNAAWRSAEVVRREWLREFFTRRTAPKNAEALILDGLLVHDYTTGKAISERHRLLFDLLGEDLTADYSRDRHRRYAQGALTPKAATMRTLAVIVAAWESTTGVHTWRSGDEWDAQVISALIEWGYEASDVERGLLRTDEVAQAS